MSIFSAFQPIHFFAAYFLLAKCNQKNHTTFAPTRKYIFANLTLKSPSPNSKQRLLVIHQLNSFLRAYISNSQHYVVYNSLYHY